MAATGRRSLGRFSRVIERTDFASINGVLRLVLLDIPHQRVNIVLELGGKATLSRANLFNNFIFMYFAILSALHKINIQVASTAALASIHRESPKVLFDVLRLCHTKNEELRDIMVGGDCPHVANPENPAPECLVHRDIFHTEQLDLDRALGKNTVNDEYPLRSDLIVSCPNLEPPKEHAENRDQWKQQGKQKRPMHEGEERGGHTNENEDATEHPSEICC